MSSVIHCLYGRERWAERMKPTSDSSAALGGPAINAATRACVVAPEAVAGRREGGSIGDAG